MKTSISRSMVAYLVMCGLGHAQPKDPWMGKRVFMQHGAVLKVGNDVVDDKGRSNSLLTSGHDESFVYLYRVEHVNGEWLWLQPEGGGAAGWVQSKWVIPYEQAIDFYTYKIRMDPEASLFNKRGNVWSHKKEYDIAIADYNEAIRLQPGNAMYWSNRGGNFCLKGDYDRAVADLSEAIRLNPKYANAYHIRGVAYHSKGDYDRAVADLAEAIRIDPKEASNYSSRGGVWQYKKENDKAIADYDEAIRLDPKDSAAFSSRGYCWLNKKDYDKAIADYNEASRLDPKNSSLLNNRGYCWFKRRDYERAIADFETIKKNNPTYEWVYGEWALLLATSPDEKHRDGKKAIEYATRACETSGWKEVYHINVLAAAHAEVGDFSKAVEWQEKANKLYADAEDKKKGEERLKLYRDKKPYRDEG